MAGRQIVRTLVIFVVLVVLLGVIAPFLNADRYRRTIEESISTALGRPVKVGEIRLNLFTGPGFDVRDVVIADDPDSRTEPIAYVGNLSATPRIWSFWTGHLEFSSLVLNDAHLNLARSEKSDGAAFWNFESLLRPRLLAAFPSVHIRGSRVNFTFNGRKNTFYLLNADLDITPHDRAGMEWDLRFRGEPARTDRPAHGFGALEARGRWAGTMKPPGKLELDLRLERSELGDLVALVNGHDAGVHGAIAGRVHVAGPLDSLGVEGDLRISELHGWDQSPPPGGVFAFRLSGTVNSRAQRLELFTAPLAQPATVNARLSVDNYLRQPKWQFEMRSDALPVVSIPSLLHNFGAAVPEGLRLEGTLAGGVRYSEERGWTGEASIRDVAIELRNSTRDVTTLRFAEATLALAGGVARLSPAGILAGANEIGTVGGEYELLSGSFHVRVTSGGGPLSDLLQGFPFAAIPLLSTLQSGDWRGDLNFNKHSAAAGTWSGAGIVSNAVVSLPALAEPLRILEARVRLDDDALQMDRLRLRSGDLEVAGEYRYVPGVPRPHQFRLKAEEADAAALEVLFQPVLRPRGSLFDIAMSLGRRTTPAWLRAMHADGTIEVAELRAAGHALHHVRARLRWDGPLLDLGELQAQADVGSLAGDFTISVAGAKPKYAGLVKLLGAEWQNGVIDADLKLQSAGSGLELLTNLNVEGTFEGRDVELAPLGGVGQLSAEGLIDWGANSPRVHLPHVRLTLEGETWAGTGESGDANGDIVLRLANRGRQMNLEGSLTDPGKAWIARPPIE